MNMPKDTRTSTPNGGGKTSGLVETEQENENEEPTARRDINKLLRYRVESECERAFELEKSESIRKELLR
jgi:hypothetical protein